MTNDRKNGQRTPASFDQYEDDLIADEMETELMQNSTCKKRNYLWGGNSKYD
ncbi:MAG: hypothetical protein JST48_09705 [Bacteroidetes bacterium]|nr:hypothetical protein [Bacteroidota bacterium]